MIPENDALKKEKNIYFLLVLFLFFNNSVDDNRMMHWEKIFKGFQKNWY